MSISSSLLNFFAKFDELPEDAKKIVEESTYCLVYKGFGTPKCEMKFMHDVFLYLHEKEPEFQQFSWEQYVGYNDNYDHFKIDDITINEYIDLDTGITFWWDKQSETELTTSLFLSANDDRDRIEYCLNKNIDITILDSHSIECDLFAKYSVEKYKNLEKPALLFLLFMKLLEYKFSMYYFLYTFGNATTVIFNKEGVIIKKMEENHYNQLGFDSDF